jgi:DNA-binding transcriptional ArsR family regulator
MEDFVLFSKALSDRTRVRMLKLLEDGELCVCEIMEALSLGQSTASKHLGILRNAGLVECGKKGTWSYYRLADKRKRGCNLDFLQLLSSRLNKDETVVSDKKALRKRTGKTCQ